MNNVKWCKAQSKERERERESKSQGIKRKQQDMLRGSSTQLYIPAFTTVKDFQSTSLSTKDFHKGNLHQGFGAITITRSTQLLPLQPQPPSWGKTPSQQQSPHNLRDYHKTIQGSPHNLRDTTQMHNLLNTMRAKHKVRNGFTTWWSNKQPQTISFSHTKIL